jgi:hypothetical protein
MTDGRSPSLSLPVLQLQLHAGANPHFSPGVKFRGGVAKSRAMALILMYGVGLSRSAGVGDGVDCLQGEDFDHGSARWAEMTEVEIFSGPEDVAVSTAQSLEDLTIEVLPGIGRAELEHDASHADANGRADFKKLEADGIDLGLSPFRALQA